MEKVLCENTGIFNFAKQMTMYCRFVLVLLFMCVADSESRCVKDFQECSQFFYKKQSPSFSSKHANIRHICQHFEGKDHFATMYLPEYRIPLFSAYRLDNDLKNLNYKPPEWFFEPHLAFRDTIYTTNINMGLVKKMAKAEKQNLENFDFKDYRKKIEAYQAVNEDYFNTSYDKGHLNPSSYHCVDARTATYTLTNAVPQDPSFNRLKWKSMEQLSKQIMEKECNKKGSQRFFVTGVIPSDMFIPFPEHSDEGDQQREYYRVNVPYAMWTAACCDAGPSAQSFSFSYYGQNGPYSYIMAIPITRLLHLLRLNGLEINVIFKKNCFSEHHKSNEALDKLVKTAQKKNAHSFAKMYIDEALQKHTIWF